MVHLYNRLHFQRNGMATYSSILAWRIPWTEEPGRPQSMESQRIRHDWVTNTLTLSEEWDEVNIWQIVVENPEKKSSCKFHSSRASQTINRINKLSNILDGDNCFVEKLRRGDFPGHPVAKIPYSQFSPGSIPVQGTRSTKSSNAETKNLACCNEDWRSYVPWLRPSAAK